MSGSTSGGNVIGSGSDSIVLNLSEDQQAGQDAQFTVSVDGQQIGGIQSVNASHSAGQDETFTFLGNFAPGQHTMAVTFTNNWSYPGTPGDRNLYVDGVTYDGSTVSSSTTGVYQSPLFPPNSDTGNNYGNAVYTLNDNSAASGPAVSNNNTPGAVTVGSGGDTLVLNMAEDYYNGDAQFTVDVDGQQVGGTQTVTASVAQGQSQEFDVKGNFGGGTHQVTINYLNDANGGNDYPGTTDAVDNTDRNLYVMGMNLDGGSPAGGTPWELASTGSQTFSVTAGNNSSATGSQGLFGTDGAPATSNNAAIPAGSGTSSSMSFVSSAGASSSTPTSSDTSGGSTGATTGATTGSSDPTSGAGASTSGPSDPSATGAAITAAAGSQAAPDTTSSTGSGSAFSASDTSSSGGGGHHWWGEHHAAWIAAHGG